MAWPGWMWLKSTSAVASALAFADGPRLESSGQMPAAAPTEANAPAETSRKSLRVASGWGAGVAVAADMASPHSNGASVMRTHPLVSATR
jgi:hypothetical protein